MKSQIKLWTSVDIKDITVKWFYSIGQLFFFASADDKVYRIINNEQPYVEVEFLRNKKIITMLGIKEGNEAYKFAALSSDGNLYQWKHPSNEVLVLNVNATAINLQYQNFCFINNKGDCGSIRGDGNVVIYQKAKNSEEIHTLLYPSNVRHAQLLIKRNGSVASYHFPTRIIAAEVLMSNQVNNNYIFVVTDGDLYYWKINSEIDADDVIFRKIAHPTNKKIKKICASLNDDHIIYGIYQDDSFFKIEIATKNKKFGIYMDSDFFPLRESRENPGVFGVYIEEKFFELDYDYSGNSNFGVLVDNEFICLEELVQFEDVPDGLLFGDLFAAKGGITPCVMDPVRVLFD